MTIDATKAVRQLATLAQEEQAAWDWFTGHLTFSAYQDWARRNSIYWDRESVIRDAMGADLDDDTLTQIQAGRANMVNLDDGSPPNRPSANLAVQNARPVLTVGDDDWTAYQALDDFSKSWYTLQVQASIVRQWRAGASFVVTGDNDVQYDVPASFLEAVQFILDSQLESQFIAGRDSRHAYWDALIQA